MREIKFRAWHEGQMHQVQTLMFNTEGIHFAGILFGEYPAVGVHATSDVSDMVFMQYTGLHDKNGREVYEGDIVEATLKDEDGTSKVIEQVTIDGGLLRPFFTRVFFGEQWWKNRISNGFKVIGNIYEHPELTVTMKAQE